MKNITNPVQTMGDDMTDDDFLTLRQAAQRLEMHPDTLGRLIREGKFNGIRTGPRRWRIAPADVNAYQERGTHPSSILDTIEVISLHAAGETARKIATRLRLPKEAVERILNGTQNRGSETPRGSHGSGPSTT